MWTYEHSHTVNASPAVIWPLYADVSRWPSWDADMERVDLDAGFLVGSTGVMHVRGFGPVPFALTVVEPEQRFADVSNLDGGIILSFEHTLVPNADNSATVITHRVTIDGPSADQVGPQMGAGISEGIPDSMASIARLAESSE
jgi:Polyketide cyclase / dehydrase and lipid transport